MTTARGLSIIKDGTSSLQFVIHLLVPCCQTIVFANFILGSLIVVKIVFPCIGSTSGDSTTAIRSIVHLQRCSTHQHQFGYSLFLYLRLTAVIFGQHVVPVNRRPSSNSWHVESFCVGSVPRNFGNRIVGIFPEKHHLCHCRSSTTRDGTAVAIHRTQTVVGVSLVPFCRSQQRINATATHRLLGCCGLRMLVQIFHLGVVFLQPGLHIHRHLLRVERATVRIAQHNRNTVIGTCNNVTLAFTYIKHIKTGSHHVISFLIMARGHQAQVLKDSCGTARTHHFRNFLASLVGSNRTSHRHHADTEHE